MVSLRKIDLVKAKCPKCGWDAQRGGPHDHKRRAQYTTNTEFIGVDGEGIDDWLGRHIYVLLGVGDQQIENPNGLHWTECFEFLYEQFLEHRYAAFAGFYLGYDFTNILRSLSEHCARMLYTAEGIAARTLRRARIKKTLVSPVRDAGWEFDLLGDKRLKLRPIVDGCQCQEPRVKCTAKHANWMYICDAGPFWQASLLTVINPANWDNPVVSEDEYLTIAAGKERRSNAVLDDDMRRYNKLENDVFARIMSELDKGFQQIGVKLKRDQWYGPGQAAQVWLNKHGCIKREELEEVCPPDFLQAAMDSYFGGWFEIMAHGIVPGITHEYDLNSAYPHIIRGLPCLQHGKYSSGTGTPPKDGYTLVYGTLTAPAKSRTGAHMHRTPDGRILRPVKTEGWFWKHEIDSGISAGVVDSVSVQRWHHYSPCDCLSPLRRVANLYQMRLDVGKETVLGKACKLVYNSIYGKFAQSVGKPRFSNPIYASLITSGCRALILDAIATHPKGQDALVMVATDGVYFAGEPHTKLKLSDQLGEWGHKEKSNLALFKPGIYWDDKARQALADRKLPVFKTRGVNVKDFAGQISHIDELFQSWLETRAPEFTIELDPSGHGTLVKGWPEVRFEAAFSLTTARQALNNGKWTDAGKVCNNKAVNQASAPYDKRTGLWFDEQWGIFRSNVQKLKDPVSTPYDKKFGFDDPSSADSLNQFGTTMDELTSMHFRFIQRVLTGDEE